MKLTSYTCKIRDDRYDMVFTKVFKVDTTSLAAAMSALIDNVDRLNVSDRRPEGTYRLIGVEKITLSGELNNER